MSDTNLLVAQSADSIFLSIKKMLGLSADYDAFDLDVLIHINTAFSTLDQIGATTRDGFEITGPYETWSGFFENRKHVQMVKSFIYFKVKLAFDPPPTSFAIEAIQKQIDELTFRLNISELVFNPDAYADTNAGSAFYWTLLPGSIFPEGAQIGDLGIDPVTGDVWRKL